MKLFACFLGALIAAVSFSTDTHVTLELGSVTKVRSGKQLIHAVRATLVNHTNDTIYYESRSCSWAEFYEVKSSGLQPKIICDKNFPTIDTLAPNSRKVRMLELTGKPDGMPLTIAFHLSKAKAHTGLSNQAQFEKTILIVSNEVRP